MSKRMDMGAIVKAHLTVLTEGTRKLGHRITGVKSDNTGADQMIFDGTTVSDIQEMDWFAQFGVENCPMNIEQRSTREMVRG